MWRKLGMVLAVVGALVVAACGVGSDNPDAMAAGGGGGADPHGRQGAVAPLADDGRWLVDDTGRVVLLHGVNEVYKSAPFYPAADDFGADDAEFLADHGFNAVRLGVDFRGVMPEPGQIDHGYIEHLATSVEQLAEERIFVLLDFHQDGFAPKYNGNGFPDWMGIDDGLPNPPDAVFPLYYIQNPAMQRAFERFWANRPGPDGVGLQDHFVAGLTAVAQRFADEPYVVGYELMNEPWPGANWQPCVLGPVDQCADLEETLLLPFHRRATAAVREVTETQSVWVEPFVLFNFGTVPTTIPGAASGNGLSFHSYALDITGEQQVVANAVAAAERDGVPLLETEYGATNDGAVVQRLTSQADDALVSWMFWAYNENVMVDRSGPAGLDRVHSRAVLDALVRPYPVAVTGTPTSAHYDPATRTYELAYATSSPSGDSYARRLETVVVVPDLHYGAEGYTVEVTGADVTSRPCAERLTLRNRPHAAVVSVRVAPGGAPCP